MLSVCGEIILCDVSSFFIKKKKLWKFIYLYIYRNFLWVASLSYFWLETKGSGAGK